MAIRKFIVERIRFHFSDKNKLVFTGWFHPLEKKACALQVFQSGKELLLDMEYHKGAEIRQKYLGNAYEINEEVIGTVTLPADWKSAGRLALLLLR